MGYAELLIRGNFEKRKMEKKMENWQLKNIDNLL